MCSPRQSSPTSPTGDARRDPAHVRQPKAPVARTYPQAYRRVLAPPVVRLHVSTRSSAYPA